MASLCPFLDLFNHKSGTCWLKIEVAEETIEISTNVRVEEGEEMFHNYGKWTNETFLFAFGFSVEDNEDDGVFVRLMVGSASSSPPSSPSLSSETSLGAFTVKRGGLQGVPKVFLKALR